MVLLLTVRSGDGCAQPPSLRDINVAKKVLQEYQNLLPA